MKARDFFWASLFAGLVLCAAITTVAPSWFSILIAVTWACAFGLTQCLMVQLPRGLRQLQASNCIRDDGTRSQGRSEIERQARDRLRNRLATLVVPLVFANLALLMLVQQLMVPLDIAVDVASKYRPDTVAWRESIAPEEARFRRWHEESNIPVTADAYKKLLWQERMWLVSLSVLWACGNFALVKSYWHHLLRRFQSSAVSRAEQYFLRDLGRVQASFDWAARDEASLPPGTEVASTP